MIAIGLVTLGALLWTRSSSDQRGNALASESEATAFALRAVNNYSETWDALALYSELHPVLRRSQGRPDEKRAAEDKAIFGGDAAASMPTYIGRTSGRDTFGDHTIHTVELMVESANAKRTADVKVREQEGRMGLASLSWRNP